MVRSARRVGRRPLRSAAFAVDAARPHHLVSEAAFPPDGESDVYGWHRERMPDQGGPEGEGDVGDSVRDLLWLAGVLDRASQEPSRYLMAAAGRTALGLSVIDGIPDELAVGQRALVWALAYHVETVDSSGQRRVRLAPAVESDDGSDPPPVGEVDEAVAEAWRSLLQLVTEPAAVARLHHLLFERGGADRRNHARAATEAYMGSAERWERGLDAVLDLTAATRLARAVGNEDLFGDSLNRMSELVTRYLSETEPPAGIILRGLEHLVGEPGCPGGVDVQLTRAASTWPDARRNDQVLALMLRRAKKPEDRREIWRRRVDAFTAEASTASSAILRAMRLQQALALAEQSGDRNLRERAAAELQTIRLTDLGMMSFTVSSRQYEEEFDRQVAIVSGGENWKQSLIQFATFGTLSGMTERNRDIVRAQHREHPLSALFPTTLLGPDGLPAYAGNSEGDRFDVDLARWETQLIDRWVPVMSAALHEIPNRHGLPALAEITAFLNTWPAVEGGTGAALARSLLRFWAGDSEAAAYTLVPRIESLARSLVLTSERGIYRLQREHTPGQYAGLGALLAIVEKEYHLDESRSRFLSVLLRHPAGCNLRNLMLHGFSGDPGPGITAVLIHAALMIATISPDPDSHPERTEDHRPPVADGHAGEHERNSDVESDIE